VNPEGHYKLDDIIETVELMTDCRHIFKTLFESRDEKAIKRRLRTIAGFIRKTVYQFQASADNKIKEEHVFWKACIASSERSKWRQEVSKSKYVSWAKTFFQEVWNKCNRVKQGYVGKGITHDAYLKCAQLEQMPIDFDVIMVDESQDMTPCQGNLFWGDHQTTNKVIYLFGDYFQQLYRFRGAGDSFQKLFQIAIPKFNLSGSFRFGKNIAAFASCILKGIGGETLYGRALDEGKVKEAENIKKGIVLCRSNNGMYQYIQSQRPKRWCFLQKSLKPRKSSKRWEEDLEKFLAALLGQHEEEADSDDGNDYTTPSESIFLYKGEKLVSIEDIRNFAEDEGDDELSRTLSLLLYLKSVGTEMSSFTERINSSFYPLEENECPDDYDGVVLSTVHTAKGLEFDSVLIFNDFNFECIMKAAAGQSNSLDEANTLYVAVTRARRHLYLTAKAKKCFNHLAFQVNIGLPNHLSSEVLLAYRTKWKEDWALFLLSAKNSGHYSIGNIDDIVWPPYWDDPNNMFALDRNMPKNDTKKYIRRIRLAYHPDKFLRILRYPKYWHIKHVKKLKDEVKERLNNIIHSCTTYMEQYNPEFDSYE